MRARPPIACPGELTEHAAVAEHPSESEGCARRAHADMLSSGPTTSMLTCGVPGRLFCIHAQQQLGHRLTDVCCACHKFVCMA